MDEQLKDKLEVDKNGAVTRQSVQKFFIDNCHDLLVNKTIEKRDLEGFLSSLNYSVHGDTKIAEIAPRLFGDSLRYDLFKKATRAAPPKPIDTSINYSPPSSKRSQAGLRSLLEELEQKIFKAKTTHFKVFHAFDHDNDGFVSLDDMFSHLSRMQVQATDKQVEDLFKHLDRNKNGFLDFNDFSKGIHSRMADDYTAPNPGVPDTSPVGPGVLSPGEQFTPAVKKETDRAVPQNRRAASWQPDQTAHIRAKKVKDDFLAIKKNFEPDKDLMIKPKHYTRFTSRPPHQNTFANYHAGEGSSIYISEKVSVDLIISGTLEPDPRSEYHSGVSERRARQEAESV